MRYSDLISINKQFKSSVNIEYDLLKYEKLSEYIPTEDACEVLKYYFDSLEDNRNFRSTILEGPYGKGKSYLVLTLLHLLQLDLNNSNVQSFLNKLQKVDKNLYSQYINIKANGAKLLPIIINSNYTHLPQALNMALKEALDRAGLNDLFPNTAYEIGINVIKQWKVDPEVDRKVISKCLEKTGITIIELEKGLKEYNQDIFEKFVDLYNCVVNGLSFNPFSSDDVVKNYRDISNKLSDYGYTGIFIVFDEFSKFIEAENNSLSADLKVLQDLAEMVNRSEKNSQMHLCCITHKSLNSYYVNKRETVVNSFRTVEGRFKEIRFNRSLNQNYHIISLTLNKNFNFEVFYNDFYRNNKNFYENVCSHEIFKDVNHELLTKGCFPLNPITTYAVVKISELIAQNERTLFTFISDNDANSLSTFISNNSDGMFNVDKIYDYFYDLLEKNDDEEIRRINYKTQVCLSKTANNLLKRIIKVLSIIKIMNDAILVPDVNTISLCLNEDENSVQLAINELVDNKLLKQNFSNKQYDFALASSKVIDTKVDAYLLSKSKKENISSILNNIFDSNYVLPRKYNAKHKMTRFYKQKFICDFELLNLNSFGLLFEKEFCDGIIFNVINTGIEKEKLVDYFHTIERNQTVILRLVDKPLSKDIISEIFRINALDLILKDKNIDEDIIKEETSLIKSDEISELEHVLNELYKNANVEVISEIDEHNYLELLSEIMERVYNCTPVINLEMVNKEQGVSTQYLKPRNTIVNLYLNNQISKEQTIIEGFSPTSPENTLFNSIKETVSLEKRKVLDLIKEYLINSEDKKVNAQGIVEKLKSAPYGVRAGVLPLLFAMAISELDGNILFYFEKRELDLNADNINKMINNPDKYYFSLEKGTIEKTNYLNELMNIFESASTNNFGNDIKLLVKNIQKWILSQPKIIRSQTKQNNFILLDEKIIELKTIFTSFNINGYEAIFEKIPSLFNNDYINTIIGLKKLKTSLDEYVEKFSTKLILSVKEIVDPNSNSSLYSSFEDWISATDANKRLLEDKEKQFVAIFERKDYDDISLINNISKSIVHIKIADWEKDHSKEICIFIENLVNNISDRRLSSEVIDDSEDVSTDENFEISDIGILLRNNISDVFDEFADSVSTEEKINILKQLIKKMM